MRKGAGKEARLSYLANALMENRNGLIVGVDVRHATGTAGRDYALALVERHLRSGATLGADKGYDVRALVQSIERRGVRAHIARHTKNGRHSTVDGRTAHSQGHAMSQQVRKRIEQAFGWVKTIGDLRKPPVTGLAKVRAWAAWNFAAYNSNGARLDRLQPQDRGRDLRTCTTGSGARMHAADGHQHSAVRAPRGRARRAGSWPVSRSLVPRSKPSIRITTATVAPVECCCRCCRPRKATRRCICPAPCCAPRPPSTSRLPASSCVATGLPGSSC